MFLLNSGRYIVADPEVILKESTLKKLWESDSRFDSHILETPQGIITAFPAGKNGLYRTTTNRKIPTASGYISFASYGCAEKLLPFEALRINLANPALLFFEPDESITLDGVLTIFLCQN